MPGAFRRGGLTHLSWMLHSQSWDRLERQCPCRRRSSTAPFVTTVASIAVGSPSQAGCATGLTHRCSWAANYLLNRCPDMYVSSIWHPLGVLFTRCEVPDVSVLYAQIGPGHGSSRRARDARRRVWQFSLQDAAGRRYIQQDLGPRWRRLGVLMTPVPVLLPASEQSLGVQKMVQETYGAAMN